MNKKSRFLIFFTVLAMLSFIIASVSAQEIDVDSMDNSELMTLLQGISQKLKDYSDDDAGKEADPLPTPEPTPTALPPLPDASRLDLYENEELLILYRAIRQKFDAEGFAYEGTKISEPRYQVYTQKKLMVEALPGYMFIQKPSGSGDDSEPEMQWASLEECDIFCMHQCQGWNPKGYMETNKGCYDSCLMENCTAWGDPIPDWAK